MGCFYVSNKPPKFTIKHTDNVPIGYADRVQESERGVCLKWVNVGGLGGESEIGYFI